MNVLVFICLATIIDISFRESEEQIDMREMKIPDINLRNKVMYLKSKHFGWPNRLSFY